MSTIDTQALLTKSFLYTSTGTVNEKLLRIFKTQLDEFENELTALKLLLSIPDNRGTVLEHLGTNLCLDRVPGQTDEEYRVYQSVAIASQSSNGTIPELVEIGRVVAGVSDESVFRPYEMWRNTGVKYLDATWPLDGVFILSPSEKDPGNVECHIEGRVEDLGAPLQVGAVVEDIKAAGIGITIRITFQLYASEMVSYSGDINTLSSIAIGTGGTSTGALPEDTGLTTEIARKTCGALDLGDGNWSYTIRIPATDLNGSIIDEIAAFDNTGAMIVKDTFSGKEKTSALYYEFCIIDDL
jgi:hypothetical protein